LTAANSLLAQFRRIRPALLSVILVFAAVFGVTYFGAQSNGRFNFQIVPAWIEALAVATVCTVAIGILVALFTWGAKGKEQRIQEMLNRK
jgi:hypothetical protein